MKLFRSKEVLVYTEKRRLVIKCEKIWLQWGGTIFKGTREESGMTKWWSQWPFIWLVILQQYLCCRETLKCQAAVHIYHGQELYLCLLLPLSFPWGRWWLRLHLCPLENVRKTKIWNFVVTKWDLSGMLLNLAVYPGTYSWMHFMLTSACQGLWIYTGEQATPLPSLNLGPSYGPWEQLIYFYIFGCVGS